MIAQEKGFHFGRWGFDLKSRDLSVSPGDNFFTYTEGAWYENAVIPPDQSGVGAYGDLYDRVQRQLRDVIESAARNPKTARAVQIGKLYRAVTNEARLEALDSKPLEPDLACITSASNRRALATIMARTHKGFGRSFFALEVGPDPLKPSRNTLTIGQGGLGLPDRDYYLKPKYKEQRAAYRAWVMRALLLAHQSDAADAARRVIELETTIADASWSVEERRDIDKTTHPMSIAELQAYAPGLNWSSYLSSAGVRRPRRIILLEDAAVQKIARIFAQTPLGTLKAWATYHLVDSAAPYLSRRFVESRFELTKSMTGVKTQSPRWKFGVTTVNDVLGEVVGHEYVARYFPPQSKRKIKTLVVNLKGAMARQIEAAGWMAPTTKVEALKKLAKMEVQVGYPDKWRDYSGLAIDAVDLYGDVQRGEAFEWSHHIHKLGKPVDLALWDMTPQTLNAYNGFPENKVTFAAALLQPPFFDPMADPAVNYGAIGAVIGHEISHGFDDQGRKVDALGRLRDWWTLQDSARFNAEAAKLEAQFDAYEPLPGYFVNGKLTLGENIADLGGLEAALAAYHASLHGKAASLIDGVTGDQRLFLGFAQRWRVKERVDDLEQRLASDPHAPAMYRSIGPTRNIDAWYSAFDVKGGTYYLKPLDRVRIW